MELFTSGIGLKIEMCHGVSTPPIFNVDVVSTDEDIILFLGGRKAGDPTPANVVTEVNPFSFKPWDSPEGMWYLYNSSVHKQFSEGGSIDAAGNGYWKPIDDIPIVLKDDITGRKTSLEFYNSSEPFSNRTRWTMHQYHIDLNAFHGSTLSKGRGEVICRMFLQNDRSPSIGDFDSCDEYDIEDIECMLMKYLGDESSSLADALIITSHLEREERQPASADSSIEFSNSFSSSDFLELNDLYDLDRPLSSSSGSSIMSINSDEYFDAGELLAYLEGSTGQLKPDNTVYKPLLPSSLNGCRAVEEEAEDEMHQYITSRSHRKAKSGQKHCCLSSM